MGDANTAANTAATTATGAGAMTTAASALGFINEYAVVIGFVLTIVSILVGVYFNVQTMKWRKAQQDEKLAQLVADALKEIEATSKQERCD